MVSTLKFDYVSVMGQFAIASHGRAFSIQRGLAGYRTFLPRTRTRPVGPVAVGSRISI